MSHELTVWPTSIPNTEIFILQLNMLIYNLQGKRSEESNKPTQEKYA